MKFLGVALIGLLRGSYYFGNHNFKMGAFFSFKLSKGKNVYGGGIQLMK